MSRRSRHRRQGAAQFPAAIEQASMPLTHESVRQALPEARREAQLRMSRLVAPGVPIRAVERREWPGRLFRARGIPSFSPAKHAVRRSKAVSVWHQLRSLWMRAPSRVRFCVQRKERKEVLFAYRKIGFSGSSPGRFNRYRRTENSAYGC